jgi:hypothetical protein
MPDAPATAPNVIAKERSPTRSVSHRHEPQTSVS